MTRDRNAARYDAIVIGASAGGIEALSQLLPAFSLASNVAVLVVVHMPRQRPSLLPGLFSKRCALSVREATDKEPVVAGTLYVAPPDYHLLVEQGPFIALSADEPVNYSRPSIDALFDSAADIYRRRLVGIILSGANDDGAAGIAAVHRRGGLALVQDPSTAAASAMCVAALARTPEAARMTLDEMHDWLSNLNGE